MCEKIAEFIAFVQETPLANLITRVVDISIEMPYRKRQFLCLSHTRSFSQASGSHNERVKKGLILLLFGRGDTIG